MLLKTGGRRVDRLSGDVLPDVVDKHNHIWDAVRYALVPLHRQKGMGMYYWLERKANELKEGRGA